MMEWWNIFKSLVFQKYTFLNFFRDLEKNFLNFFCFTSSKLWRNENMFMIFVKVGDLSHKIACVFYGMTRDFFTFANLVIFIFSPFPGGDQQIVIIQASSRLFAHQQRHHHHHHLVVIKIASIIFRFYWAVLVHRFFWGECFWSIIKVVLLHFFRRGWRTKLMCCRTAT